MAKSTTLKTARVTLQLPQRVLRAYGALAALEGMPRAHLMQQVLAQHLAADETGRILIQLGGNGAGTGEGKNGVQRP